MFELALIVLQLALFLGTLTVYLLARRTASTNAAMQKNLDELLQELQATSELVVNDLNERARAIRALLDQADTRRQHLDSATDRATPRPARDLPTARPILAPESPGRITFSEPGRRESQPSSRPVPPRQRQVVAAEPPTVQSLAADGLPAVEIARQLGITREEVDMALSYQGTYKSVLK
jgi:uncharacterized membrane-anchored protein YhcB (DUF1043 family)